jgi:hypothetical protein
MDCKCIILQDRNGTDIVCMLEFSVHVALAGCVRSGHMEPEVYRPITTAVMVNATALSSQTDRLSATECAIICQIVGMVTHYCFSNSELAESSRCRLTMDLLLTQGCHVRKQP